MKDGERELKIARAAYAAFRVMSAKAGKKPVPSWDETKDNKDGESERLVKKEERARLVQAVRDLPSADLSKMSDEEAISTAIAAALLEVL